MLILLSLFVSVMARRPEILHYSNFPLIQPYGNSSNSHDLLPATPISSTFNWCNNNGKNYCVPAKNQHIPHYCGSCWCVSATQALSTRISIARGGINDIVLSCQHMLNCGSDYGSCYGGQIDSVYQWLSKNHISYETSMPYIACSSDSKEGFCGSVDTTCKAVNVARTCGSFSQEQGPCSGLSHYPNATISDYGSISGKDAMQKEILARGPIVCGVDAMPLLNYEGGIIKNAGSSIDHVVEVVGWGDSYWIIRNTWGEYWGIGGFAYISFGSLLIEEQCSWAVPDKFTIPGTNSNYPCHEDGGNCKSTIMSIE